MTTDYEKETNHRQWLTTVPDDLLPFVANAIAAWDAKADRFNKWRDLGWDERDSLVREQAACAAMP